MRKIVGYIGVAVVVGVVVVALRGGYRPALVAPTTDQSAAEPRDLCYIWNTEAGDNASLKLSLSGAGGTQVSGFFHWYPAEKDSKAGDFTGTAGPVDPQSMSRTATLQWQPSAEGTKNTEQLLVHFGEGSAAVGFGEMREQSPGVFVYADPSVLSFAPTLQQTDCADSALR